MNLESTTKAVLELVLKKFPGTAPVRIFSIYDIPLGFNRELCLCGDEKEIASSRGHRGLRLSLYFDGTDIYGIDISPVNPDLDQIETWIDRLHAELTEALTEMATRMDLAVSQKS